MNKKLIAQLDDIIKYLRKQNFRACYRISKDFILLSNFFDFEDGILVGEFMYSIFNDLTELVYEYALKENEIKRIINTNVEFIEGLKKFISPKGMDINALYKSAKRARVLMTRLQFECERSVRKKRFPPFMRQILEEE